MTRRDPERWSRIIYGGGVSSRPTPMYDKGICHRTAFAFDYRYTTAIDRQMRPWRYSNRYLRPIVSYFRPCFFLVYFPPLAILHALSSYHACSFPFFLLLFPFSNFFFGSISALSLETVFHSVSRFVYESSLTPLRVPVTVFDLVFFLISY